MADHDSYFVTTLDNTKKEIKKKGKELKKKKRKEN